MSMGSNNTGMCASMDAFLCSLDQGDMREVG